MKPNCSSFHFFQNARNLNNAGINNNPVNNATFVFLRIEKNLGNRCVSYLLAPIIERKTHYLDTILKRDVAVITSQKRLVKEKLKYVIKCY